LEKKAAQGGVINSLKFEELPLLICVTLDESQNLISKISPIITLSGCEDRLKW
jgi:hypothetical protein